MMGPGKNSAELANFSCQLRRLYKATDDPSHLMLDLAITQGTLQQSLTVDYDKLDQLDIQRLVPGCVYLASRAKAEITKLLRLSVAQALQSEAQVGVLYTQSGWQSQALECSFIAGGAVISQQGIAAPTSAMITRDVSSLHLAMDASLAPERASELLLRALLNYGDYAIPAFSYTLYAMLHSVWPEVKLPTACVLNLLGNQGFGKTTLARTFCALYDSRNGRIADFYDASSTAASLKRALDTAKDRVIVLDDLCRSTSRREMQLRRDLASRLVRHGANESSSSQMDGNKKVNFICRGGLVMTGEIPFKAPSDVTRCVIIEVKEPLRKGGPDDRNIAATATAAYIQWLCAHFEHEMERLKSDFHMFRDNAVSKTHWRLQQSLFQLDWCFDSFLRFSYDVGAVSETAQQQFEQRASKIFQGIFNKEDSLVQRLENSQPSRWKQLVMEGAKQKAFPCRLKPGCICVKPTDLTSFLSVALQNPALQEREVIKQLKLQKLLLMDQTGKSTKKVAGNRMLNINL